MSTHREDWSQIEDPVERTRAMLEVETGEPASTLERETDGRNSR